MLLRDPKYYSTEYGSRLACPFWTSQLDGAFPRQWDLLYLFDSHNNTDKRPCFVGDEAPKDVGRLWLSTSGDTIKVLGYDILQQQSSLRKRV